MLVKVIIFLRFIECDIVSLYDRSPDPGSRPRFVDIIRVLNQPEFKVLKWSPEDLNQYDMQSRTVGGVVENGTNLFTELQQAYREEEPAYI